MSWQGWQKNQWVLIWSQFSSLWSLQVVSTKTVVGSLLATSPIEENNRKVIISSQLGHLYLYALCVMLTVTMCRGFDNSSRPPFWIAGWGVPTGQYRWCHCAPCFNYMHFVLVQPSDSADVWCVAANIHPYLTLIQTSNSTHDRPFEAGRFVSLYKLCRAFGFILIAMA